MRPTKGFGWRATTDDDEHYVYAIALGTVSPGAPYIDFDAVTRQVFDQAFKRKIANDADTGKNDPGTLIGKALGEGIGSTRAGPIAQTIKMCFQQEVSDPHQQKDHVGALELTAAMWPIHREAVTETTWGTDKKGRHIELTLTRTEGRWPVTGIGGDALRQQPDDAVRANLLPGAPNPDL